ncbi:MAG TPA: anthranilate phosphoribosyltransferase [Candidatus Xenobia bacterium]|jgi:anthranilate phosphoribosyltransferase
MGDALKAFLEGATLQEEGARELFGALVRGELNDIEITALLVALKTRGETPDVLTGAASALRAAAVPFPRPSYEYADPCGTGGDGRGTVNISTAVAVVAAELGLRVAKHGNRSVSSQCGSADVLEAVGVAVEMAPVASRRVLDEAGICFLFAPQYHGGLRAAMNVRRTLKTRTIFNLLGPLLNPAAPPYQVVGVYDERWCRPMAETLARLGCRGALVVHGSGVDEIALHGPTQCVCWREERLQEMTLRPSEVGLEEAPLEALSGGSPADNARWLLGLLGGQGASVHRQAVAFNTGALLWLSGRADSIRDGVQMGMEVLSRRRGLDRLERWREATRGAV